MPIVFIIISNTICDNPNYYGFIKDCHTIKKTDIIVLFDNSNK